MEKDHPSCHEIDIGQPEGLALGWRSSQAVKTEAYRLGTQVFDELFPQRTLTASTTRLYDRRKTRPENSPTFRVRY